MAQQTSRNNMLSSLEPEKAVDRIHADYEAYKNKHYATITIEDIRRALKILEDKLDEISGVKK